MHELQRLQRLRINLARHYEQRKQKQLEAAQTLENFLESQGSSENNIAYRSDNPTHRILLCKI